MIQCLVSSVILGVVSGLGGIGGLKLEAVSIVDLLADLRK